MCSGPVFLYQKMRVKLLINMRKGTNYEQEEKF